MEKMTFTSLIFFLLIFYSCSSSNQQNSKHVIIANKLTNKTIKTIENNYAIKLIGSGGSMMENIKEISLHFIDNKPQTIEQSREKIVRITSELISAFNSDLEIRPFLSNYPFNAENFYVTISFEKNGKYLEQSISYASKRKKIIDYCIFNNKEKKLVEILEENYEDALNIVYIDQKVANSSDRLQII